MFKGFEAGRSHRTYSAWKTCSASCKGSRRWRAARYVAFLRRYALTYTAGKVRCPSSRGIPSSRAACQKAPCTSPVGNAGRCYPVRHTAPLCRAQQVKLSGLLLLLSLVKRPLQHAACSSWAYSCPVAARPGCVGGVCSANAISVPSGKQVGTKPTRGLLNSVNGCLITKDVIRKAPVCLSTVDSSESYRWSCWQYTFASRHKDSYHNAFLS